MVRFSAAAHEQPGIHRRPIAAASCIVVLPWSSSPLRSCHTRPGEAPAYGRRSLVVAGSLHRREVVAPGSWNEEIEWPVVE